MLDKISILIKFVITILWVNWGCFGCDIDPFLAAHLYMVSKHFVYLHVRIKVVKPFVPILHETKDEFSCHVTCQSFKRDEIYISCEFGKREITRGPALRGINIKHTKATFYVYYYVM